ncbi:MAG: outer membrane beta-barrel protein [Gallionella sp.]
MKKIALVALLSAVVATPALADNTGKFYGAVDLGSATIGTGAGNTGGTFRVSGGYHFSPMLGAEAGYTNVSATGSTVSSMSAAAVATYPVAAQFDLLGKLGLAMNTIAATGGASTSKADLYFAVGAQYNLSTQLSVRAQYENLGKFDFGQNFTASGSVISAGAAYTF